MDLMEAWERGVPGPGDTGCFMSVMSGNTTFSNRQILSLQILNYTNTGGKNTQIVV